MTKKRNYTLTFSWISGMVKSPTTGKYSSGSSSSYTGECGVFMRKHERGISVGGVMKDYSFLIIADPDIGVPVGARVDINGKEFEVMAVDPLIKHTELWV